MQLDFNGKVVLVTGATRGIGKELALSFAGDGAVVVGIGTNEGLLREVEGKLKEKSPKSSCIKCNVADNGEVKALVDRVAGDFGKIDILVNNAGVTRDNILLRMSEEEWDMVASVNLKGTFLTTKYCSKYMVRQKAGRIINISSVTAILGNKGQANYSASKAGIVAFSKSVAKEVASRNITVNVVLPGFVETDMTSSLPKDQIIGRVPAGRFAQPKDISDAVKFLASDNAGYITGAEIVVDGGLSINI